MGSLAFRQRRSKAVVAAMAEHDHDHTLGKTYQKLLLEGVESVTVNKEHILVDGKKYDKLEKEGEKPKVETVVDGKKYEKLENDFGDEDDTEGDGELRVCVVDDDVEEDGRCSCFNYVKYPMCATTFTAFMAAILVIHILFDYGREGRIGPYERTSEAWVRVILAIVILLRGVQTANVMMLAATVKRNAMYIYPKLSRHHTILLAMHGLVYILQTIIYKWNDNKWGNLASLLWNFLITGYDIVVIVHQQTNGTFRFPRRVVGDEALTWVPGQRMEIADNNRGLIRTHVDEEMLKEYAIL